MLYEYYEYDDDDDDEYSRMKREARKKKSMKSRRDYGAINGCLCTCVFFILYTKHIQHYVYINVLTVRSIVDTIYMHVGNIHMYMYIIINIYVIYL